MSTDQNNLKKAVSLSLPFTIAKYVIILAIVAFVAMTILSQRRTDAPFENVSAAVEKVINKATMHDIGRKGFRRYYGMNEAELEGMMLYQSVSGMSAEEILLVKVKTPEQAAALRESIEKRRESRINDFTGYAPEEAKMMEDAVLIEEGDYILFAAYSQQEDIKKAFQESL